MKVVNVIDEDFIQYKMPSMFIATPFCDFKCDKDNGNRYCQNWSLASAEQIDISDDDLILRYLKNPISKAIIFGGLDPFYKSFDEIVTFIEKLRFKYNCQDDVVIYTGYYKDEINDKVERLKLFGNIVVKFGRYKPNQKEHYDEVLGVMLANDEQHAEVI